MSVETFIQNFSDSLEDLPATRLTVDTSFRALKEWDSLAVLTVTDTIDMEYGVLLKKADYQSVATLGELYQLVLSKNS